MGEILLRAENIDKHFGLVGCGDLFSFKDKLAGIFLVNTCQAGC